LGSGFRAWIFWVRGLGARVWVRGLGLGVWGLGFEVWGSEFGVCELGVENRGLGSRV